jgi:hypothetical protein
MNNFHYWNFPKFGLEFELKFVEPLGFEVQWNLVEIGIELFFKNWRNSIEGLLIALRWQINS